MRFDPGWLGTGVEGGEELVSRWQLIEVVIIANVM